MRHEKWKGVVLFCMAAAILSLCSCGGGGEVYYEPPRAIPGTIELSNNSIVTLDGFYLAPVDQTSWGPNILRSSLPPGQRTNIVDIYPGFYDAQVRAAGSFSNYYGYVYDILVNDGAFVRLTVRDSSFTGSLEIRNTIPNATIIGVYVVPISAPSWGGNQISSSIGPLGVRQITDLTPGLYDVKTVWNIGPDSNYRNIRIESLTVYTLNAF